MDCEHTACIPVSVVVCVRNREAMIGRCLDSILHARPAEVIVVDGNSTDTTANIARTKGVTVVSDGGAGLGAARQLGAQRASNAYVVFVDSDVVLDSDTLQLLLAEAVEEQYDAVQAELRTFSRTPSYWQEADAWRRKDRQRKGLANVLGCQVTLVRKELLMQVQFDPAFRGSSEDADFCFRARATGARLAHSARAVAYHEDRGSLWQIAEQKIWYGRGMMRMITRYRGHYMNNAANQASAAGSALGINIRYLPYVIVSWGCTAIGMVLESIYLATHPSLRQVLREVKLGQV